MSTPACLVTSDPVSYEPVPTPPILLSVGLDPDPRRVQFLGGPSGVNVLDIKASVVSEDAGRTVKAALLIDYGFKNVQGLPYRSIVQSFPELPADTLAHGPRELEGIKYYLGSYPLDPGCHRLTLLVTHEFDTATGCPKRLFDSDQVTWHFIDCSDGTCPGSVDSCPPIEATCPENPSSGTTTGAADAATGG